MADACKGGMCVGQQLGDGTDCDDGNACTMHDACSRGMCVGQPRICDDGLDCSIDFPCDPVTGCGHDISRCPCATDADCDDHDACTGRETCDVATGTCHPGTRLDCGDGNDCTNDPCLPREGCKHVDKFQKCSFDSVKCSVPGSTPPSACAVDPKTIRQLVKRATNLIGKSAENRRFKRTMRAQKLLESAQNLGSISDACKNKLTDIDSRIDDWLKMTDCPPAPR